MYLIALKDSKGFVNTVTKAINGKPTQLYQTKEEAITELQKLMIWIGDMLNGLEKDRKMHKRDIAKAPEKIKKLYSKIAVLRETKNLPHKKLMEELRKYDTQIQSAEHNLEYMITETRQVAGAIKRYTKIRDTACVFSMKLEPVTS